MYHEIFNRLMKLMRPFMKQQGFTSRGNNYYKRHPQGNIGIINFQRNREGFPKFTMNIGIYSIILAKFFLAEFNQKQIREYPLLGEYHWQARIGDVVPKHNIYRQKDKKWLNGDDKWWHYDDKTDVDALFHEISELIAEFAIPAIDKHITDGQLKEYWLEAAESRKKNAEIEVGELHAGIKRVRAQILRKLLILLLDSGEKEKFQIMMSEFHEYLQHHPEYIGLKRDYDRLKKDMDKNFRFDSNSKRKFEDDEEGNSSKK
ncbi:DUF4304 domain-containing protein [Rickettsiella grylli]|uniref:DUF4304 domain-containing protein n=1 Tax=Rickettsiella grylli TaxID=59196 RepID=A8PKE9_9COXI|nr:DUF4304 domain-containing protein [Rickettsiella grylli]EDP46508.1 hypothetical protein RICGR_0145 [Rickettsiella grylli]